MVCNSKEHLEEKVVLFLYALSEFAESININTFKRYVYLYYLAKSFLNEKDNDSDNITIFIDKGNIRLADFNSVISDLNNRNYITYLDNLGKININSELIEFVKPKLEIEGQFADLHKEIVPFVNLLNSYDDQFIFTIFFSEPTFTEATKRGIDKLVSSKSELSKLLEKFKKKIKKTKIDRYDILTHWMNFILKNYYVDRRDNK